MGMIRIAIWGSFPEREKTFGPANNGHADLVAEAIEYLAEVVLPDAIALDHKLHDEGKVPPQGWPK